MRVRKGLLLAFCAACSWLPAHSQGDWSRATYKDAAPQYSVSIVRGFSKELFDRNSIPFMQPLVEVMNATANSRFFGSARMPKGNGKAYFRISINGMAGIIGDDQKTYTPSLPRDSFYLNSDLSQSSLAPYLEYNQVDSRISIKDTAGLVLHIFKGLINDGINEDSIAVPETGATIFGSKEASYFLVPSEYLSRRVEELLAVVKLIDPTLSPALESQIRSTISSLPSQIELPRGADLSMIGAGIPQFEVGGWYGTELLVRFVPRIRWSQTIGEFGFWGVGVRHSISQWLPESVSDEVDIAAQVGFQGSSLRNTVGVTNARLEADASMFTVNIHASKRFWDKLDVFAGLAFERFDITGSYNYALPISTQYDLGLIAWVDRNEDTNISSDEVLTGTDPITGRFFSGDTQPQKSVLGIDNNQIKGVIGASLWLDPVSIYVDYSISQFNLITGGVSVAF